MRNIDKLLEEMKSKKIDVPIRCRDCPAQKYCHSADKSKKCGECFSEWANMEVADE